MLWHIKQGDRFKLFEPSSLLEMANMPPKEDKDVTIEDLVAYWQYIRLSRRIVVYDMIVVSPYELIVSIEVSAVAHYRMMKVEKWR